MEDASRLQEHEALVSGLLNPRAYAHPVEHVERIDTHISTVLLAGEFAYKLKKPVDLGFLDFSSLEKRYRCCLEELRLNRRTAPGLYLDVVPIVATPTGPRVGVVAGEPVEYAVRMRRFDPHCTLDHLAARGQLTADLIDRLASIVARLHAEAAVAPPGFGASEAIRRLTEATIGTIRAVVQSAADRARLDALAAWAAAEWRACAAQMEARRVAGFVRECHGDLHLANIVRLDGEPVLFDGIEFNDELKFIDVTCDVAFAFMDLMDHGAPHLAWRFVGRYLEQTGDYEGLSVLRYYAVYRALVRAEVALIRLRQPELRRQVRLRVHTSFEHYLALAESLSRPGTRSLVVMTGLSGSGKSTVALELAQRLDGVRVRSDVERKRLFGFAPHDRTERAVYTTEATARTYERMTEIARAALVAGVPAVVDGAFLRRVERDRFRALARELEARFTLVACEASADILRARVALRHRSGSDASEADLDVLARQMEWEEHPSVDEGADCIRIDTGTAWPAVEE
ncbi:MAG TPA: AAA family ATPase, partial [Burkholderiaceae bacterium]|nr:AAA family ATPase [Burkholderiaceae bacterium]